MFHGVRNSSEINIPNDSYQKKKTAAFGSSGKKPNDILDEIPTQGVEEMMDDINLPPKF